MKDNPNQIHTIDLQKVSKTLWKNRKRYYKVLPIAFVLSCIWILPQPRYYTTSVTLAPESGSAATAGGGLSSIASSIGINIGNIENNDAIYPMLYPDLFESAEFTVSLYDIKITTEDGELTTDYYTYMKMYQEPNWLTKPFRDAMRWVKKFFKKKKKNAGNNGGQISSFQMSEDDYALMETIQEKIICSVDKKTDVTTITVQDQDPLVSATLADSVKVRLQNFIIQYRTCKARMDVDYYQNLVDQAFVDYERAMKKYSDYCDSHKNMILQANISERDELENQMSLKFNTYNAMNAQLEAAKAKVQERTPAFTTLKSAIVPIKPAGPKRMLFVVGMLFLAFIGTTLYILKDDFLKSFKN